MDLANGLANALDHFQARNAVVFKGKSDVVFHGRTDKLVVRVLEHKADAAAHLPNGCVVQKASKQANGAPLRPKQADQHPSDGRFAGSVMADDR